MSRKDFTVWIDGHEVPHGPSETGDFGVSKAELKHIIYGQVCRKHDKPLTQRALFNRVCRHMQLDCAPEKEEEMLKIFMQLLRQLRDEGRVLFTQDDTAVYVELP